MSAPAFNPNAPSEDVPPFDPNAASEDVAAPAPEKKSFLREAGGRIADAAHGFAENVKNIPSTSLSRVGENLKTLGHPFAEAGREVADEVTHPVRTFQGGPLARATGLSTPEAERHSDAVNREMVRGAQGNIPLAGLAHEHLTGFPESSEADTVEAPHAAGMGSVGGMAALAAAPKFAPLVGRRLAAIANASQDALAAGTEGSLARSAARRAVDPTPVRSAVKDLVDDATTHGVRHGGAAMVGQMAFGHTGAVLGAAASLAKPAWKAAVTAADEGLAAIARRVSRSAALPEAAAEYEAPASASRAAATHEAPARTVEAIEAPPERRALPPMEAKSETAHPVVEEVKQAVSPHIKVLEDALAAEKDPEQAQALRASIEGLKAKVESIRNRVSRPAPVVTEKLAPSLDERVAAMRAEPLKPATTPAPTEAEMTPPAKAEEAPAATGEPSKWKPSDSDEKFARQLGMTTEKYRDVMTQRAERLAKSPGFQSSVERLTKAARATSKPEDFVKQAASAGLSAGHARRIWEAAHGRAGATP